ncbi:MAG: glycosyltransferase [Tissierellia bacterium]|nr:glycosyltransferase [Tissierellia bacterium]
MDVTVICPLYKAEEYIDELHNSLLMQKNIKLKEIKYILTDNKDGLAEKISGLEKATLTKITPEDFSHSLVREEAAFEVNTSIIVFITQDVKIRDDNWIYKLVRPIFYNECEAAFSKQICDNNSIEKYTRIKNYPDESRIVTKKDTDKLGIRTFFFSDAASAVNTKIFKKLNGYDGKDLLTNEDMYFAYKLINSGYRIMYNSESEVIHSHDYKFKELFKRYFDQGVFLINNDYLMKYNVNGSAVDLLLFIVKESIKEKNGKVILNILPNFLARYLGNKFGQNYKRLSKEIIKKLSASGFYWERMGNFK